MNKCPYMYTPIEKATGNSPDGKQQAGSKRKQTAQESKGDGTCKV